MTAEFDISTRAGVAGMYEHETLQDLHPDVRSRMSVGRFIAGLTIGNYESVPLADVQSDDAADTPCHWRFLVPTAVQGNPLALIEFGHGGPDIAAADRQTHRRIIDAELKHERETKLPVRQLFGEVGPEMTRRVSFAGEALLAGIERRYRLDAAGNVDASWSQLIYSRKLVHTRQALLRHVRDNRIRRISEPWLEEAARVQQTDMLARLMALSALAETIDS